jgi:hypothetical protein
MDLDDMTPAGGGFLRRAIRGPHGRPVATFTAPATPDPSDIWEPFTRPTSATADGTQGDPLGGYRPGRSIEHEPVDNAEKASEHTARAAAQIRAALGPV